MMTENYLGDFKITSGKVILTDPCYKFDAKKVVPARNGHWTISTRVNRQGYICELVAFHKDTSKFLITAKELEFTCPVDSGQAGIFDAELYARHQGGKYGQLDTFYGQVCYLTCDTEQSGGVVTIDDDTFGAVSTSGYGDGDYRMEGSFYNGELVGISIYFDEDEDDEDAYEEDAYYRYW